MKRRPRLLDLYCGAGGAAMGYWRAGFDVTGVDHVPQPRYPFRFVEADALTFPLDGYDVIHASPPCQIHSALRVLGGGDYPDLIPPTRARLRAWGGLYVIENVGRAPLTNCVTLCGSSFGLGVRRHRRFETSFMIWNPPRCAHDLQPEPIDVTGGGGPRSPRKKPTGGQSRKVCVARARVAMGIDWQTRDELAQSIPPAYTEWLGEQIIACVP
jgi:hypothetical protein